MILIFIFAELAKKPSSEVFGYNPLREIGPVSTNPTTRKYSYPVLSAANGFTQPITPRKYSMSSSLSTKTPSIDDDLDPYAGMPALESVGSSPSHQNHLGDSSYVSNVLSDIRRSSLSDKRPSLSDVRRSSISDTTRSNLSDIRRPSISGNGPASPIVSSSDMSFTSGNGHDRVTGLNDNNSDRVTSVTGDRVTGITGLPASRMGGNTTFYSSDSFEEAIDEETMIPCEFCEEPVAILHLINHQVRFLYSHF